MNNDLKSKPKSFISNSIWSVSSTVWSTIVTFFLTPFLILKIGQEHYGLYMLLMSIAGMMGIVNLGLGEATLRYVSFYYAKNDIKGINRVVGSTLLVYMIMGLLSGVFLFFFSGYITDWLSISYEDRELSVSIIKLTAFNFALSFIIGVYSSIPQAILRFDISSKIAIIQNIFQVTGTVVYLLLGYGLYYIVLWGVVSALFTQIINMIVARKLLPGLTLLPVITKDGLKEVFSYGIFSSLNGIISMLSAHIDRILLAAFVNPTAVAALSVPRQILDKGGSFVQSASSVLFPKISTMTDLKEIRKVFHISSWVMLTFTMAIFAPGIVMFPKFLSTWINPEFAMTSGYIAQLLSAAYAFRGISEPYFGVLKGTNNIKKLTIILSFTNLISIFTAIPLLFYYGLNGAGYRSLLFVWLSFPISLWVNKIILQDQKVREFLNLLLATIWITVFVIFAGALVNKLIDGHSLLYVLFMWLIMSGSIMFLTYLIKKIFLKKSDLDMTQIENLLEKIKSKFFWSNGEI
jgi:O-antigen/teichoic acid export membrane protein